MRNRGFKNYVINAGGPKPEATRTEAEKKALRDRQEIINKIDDMEFMKKRDIFGEKL